MSEEAREIKVRTRKFSLRKGRLRICFSVLGEGLQIKEMFLKKRNALEQVHVPFQLSSKGNVYEAVIDLKQQEFEYAFWDVVALVFDGSETYEAILGGQRVSLKLRLILFPRWYRKAHASIIYPFEIGRAHV